MIRSVDYTPAIYIRLTKDLDAIIEEMAAADERPKAYIIRQLLREALREQLTGQEVDAARVTT